MENRALDSNSTPPHSTEEKGTETRELQQKYEKLEQDWNAFKESRSTTSHKYRSPLTPIITNPIFQKLDISNNFISPKELMSSLQRQSSSSLSSKGEEEEEEETLKDYDVVVKEILEERWEAIESERLKGRRLFDSMSESGSDHDNNNNNVVSEHEVRSMYFCHPKDGDEGDEDEGDEGEEGEGENEDEYLCSPIGDFVNKDMVGNEGDITIGSYKFRFVNGTRYDVLLGGFVVFVLLIVAMCRISYGGHDDFDVFFVPT